MASIREIPHGSVTASVLDLSKVWPDEKHRLHLQIKVGYHYDNGPYTMLKLELISNNWRYLDIVMKSISKCKTEPVKFIVDIPPILLFTIDESRMYKLRREVKVKLIYAEDMQKGLMIQTSTPEDFKIQKGNLGLPNILETYIYPTRNKEQKTIETYMHLRNKEQKTLDDFDDFYTLLRDKSGR